MWAVLQAPVKTPNMNSGRLIRCTGGQWVAVRFPVSALNHGPFAGTGNYGMRTKGVQLPWKEAFFCIQPGLVGNLQSLQKVFRALPFIDSFFVLFVPMVNTHAIHNNDFCELSNLKRGICSDLTLVKIC